VPLGERQAGRSHLPPLAVPRFSSKKRSVRVRGDREPPDPAQQILETTPRPRRRPRSNPPGRRAGCGLGADGQWIGRCLDPGCTATITSCATRTIRQEQLPPSSTRARTRPSRNAGRLHGPFEHRQHPLARHELTRSGGHNASDSSNERPARRIATPGDGRRCGSRRRSRSDGPPCSIRLLTHAAPAKCGSPRRKTARVLIVYRNLNHSVNVRNPVFSQRIYLDSRKDRTGKRRVPIRSGSDGGFLLRRLLIASGSRRCFHSARRDQRVSN